MYRRHAMSDLRYGEEYLQRSSQVARNGGSFIGRSVASGGCEFLHRPLRVRHPSARPVGGVDSGEPLRARRALLFQREATRDGEIFRHVFDDNSSSHRRTSASNYHRMVDCRPRDLHKKHSP